MFLCRWIIAGVLFCLFCTSEIVQILYMIFVWCQEVNPLSPSEYLMVHLVSLVCIFCCRWTQWTSRGHTLHPLYYRHSKGACLVLVNTTFNLTAFYLLIDYRTFSGFMLSIILGTMFSVAWCIIEIVEICRQATLKIHPFSLRSTLRRSIHQCNEACAQSLICPCVICMEPVDVLVHLPCSHQLHESCLTKWALSNPHTHCPVCRTGFDPV